MDSLPLGHLGRADTITDSFRKNEAAGLKWKHCLVVDVSGGKSKSDDVKNDIALESGMLGP